MRAFYLMIVITLGLTVSAQATTVKEMRLMCADYQNNNFNVVTKPHAYCAGYFQAQIQTAEALCKTMKILHQNKPQHRDVINGTASLFATSATAADYREVIAAFVKWAQGKDQFDKKNPSIFMNEYLPKTWPCNPSAPLEKDSE